MEVIAASVILAITVVGIFMSVAYLKKPSDKAKYALTAGYYGQQVLEELRAKVDARDWDQTYGPLYLVSNHCLDPKPINGVDYTACYTITTDPDSQARKVQVTVTYADP